MLFDHGIATYETTSTVRINCTGTARNNSSSIIIIITTTTLRAFYMYSYLPLTALRTHLSSVAAAADSFVRPMDGCCNRQFVWALFFSNWSPRGVSLADLYCSAVTKGVALPMVTSCLKRELSSSRKADASSSAETSPPRFLRENIALAAVTVGGGFDRRLRWRWRWRRRWNGEGERKTKWKKTR